MALAPTDDLELDDGWADEAVRAPPPGLATKAELRATAAAKETTEVNSEVTLDAPVLGYKDTLLVRGDGATVVNTLDSALDSKEVLLASFDGKLWTVVMETPGTSWDSVFHLPSRNLESRGGTRPM